MKPTTRNLLAATIFAASACWAQAPEPAPASEPEPAPAAKPLSENPVRSQLILPAGAWIKIRVDQPLSSDKSQPGDRFSGTIVQPVVADGLVIAHRGQTIEGRVTEAIKAGRAKGTSRLGIELIEIGLADGQQLPVRAQVIEYNGGTSKGRDAAAIGATTGTGAAIGAAAAGGFGAGMGAIAGAVASGIGVLATRGRATEIYPETVVTFRTLAPVTISTERAPHAFQPVRQTDYENQSIERRPAPQPRPTLIYGGYDPWFWGPGWYGGGWYGRGWYGPRAGFWGGPRVVIRGGGHRRR
jgi:hypothetical protein